MTVAGGSAPGLLRQVAAAAASSCSSSEFCASASGVSPAAVSAVSGTNRGGRPHARQVVADLVDEELRPELAETGQLHENLVPDRVQRQTSFEGADFGGPGLFLGRTQTLARPAGLRLRVRKPRPGDGGRGPQLLELGPKSRLPKPGRRQLFAQAFALDGRGLFAPGKLGCLAAGGGDALLVETGRGRGSGSPALSFAAGGLERGLFRGELVAARSQRYDALLPLLDRGGPVVAGCGGGSGRDGRVASGGGGGGSGSGQGGGRGGGP